jgi:predicted RNA binding protein YcfA (HicA-like mRNA interferase family)
LKLPRDISGDNLGQALKTLGYQPTRQTGSHLRLTTTQQGDHHITIPRHSPLRIGTLAAILSDVANHFAISKEELTRKLFG